MVISCVEYFELKSLLEGRMGGWMEGKAGLRIKNCTYNTRPKSKIFGVPISDVRDLTIGLKLFGFWTLHYLDRFG